MTDLDVDLEGRVAERTAELDAERAQLEELLRQMPVAVLIADAFGREVRGVNDLALDLFGPEISGAALGDLRFPLRHPDGREIRDDELPGIATARTGTATLGARYLVDLPTGETRTIDISTGPMRASDASIQGVIIMVEDVSERERVERADREFVSNAAHQIRTPITAIVTAVAALQAGAKHDADDRDRFLAHIERESDRLARLAAALLVLARVARGEGPADVAVVPLQPLLRQLVDRSGSSIALRCANDAAAVANGPLLEQALSNVIDNAVKYANGAAVSVNVARQGSDVVVEVADQGPGMTAAERERVVERFFRGTANGPGFGLGLSIAAEATHAAGAALRIESEPGSGTTVQITARGARLGVPR